MDLYSRKIVFWEIYDHENANGWKECLEKALLKENIQDASSIQFHTDNGSAYRASTFQAFLESNHIKYTHNRPLVSNDNCYMESFYATLKKRSGRFKAFLLVRRGSQMYRCLYGLL